MGLSSNQARFLSLTSRQVDLEQRIQQICQRRLRLSSELENVSTQYNNSISNRKMFTPAMSGLNNISINSLNKVGYKVIDAQTKELVQNIGLINKPSAADPAATQINSEQQFINIINVMNGGDAAATAALNDKYVLNCDIDLSDNGAFAKNVIGGLFTGTFDGQGHTISGANITVGGADQFVGFFSKTSAGANIKNLVVDDFNVTGGDCTQTQPYPTIAGVLVGQNLGTITNTAATDSTMSLGNYRRCIGGLVGQNAGSITSSYSTTDITTGHTALYVGGLVGDINSGGSISQSYSTGDVIVGTNSSFISGFVSGRDDGPTTITNCYSTGDVVCGASSSVVGGFTDGSWHAGSSVTNCYTTGDATYGGTAASAFTGYYTAGTVGGTNFYKNNSSFDLGSAVNANVNPIPANFKTAPWDSSGDLPTLIGTNDTSAALEEGLRNGKYSLARKADEFTQDPLDINGDEYQEVDWRSTPEIYDELYKGDDVDAENKYDKTISEINSQDKKLQLEQTSIEVEYKAISSERESVKKILDTNAQASFKYFS